MRRLVLASRKYGDKVIKISDEDYEKVKSYIWSIKPDGSRFYAHRYVDLPNGGRTSITMHRFILESELKPEDVVDHINGDGLDNRRSNLRIVDKAVNARNRKIFSTNTSGYTGVTRGYQKDKDAYYWQAKIEVNGKCYKKIFYERKYGADIAKTYAINARKLMEREYGFITREDD